MIYYILLLLIIFLTLIINKLFLKLIVFNNVKLLNYFQTNYNFFFLKYTFNPLLKDYFKIKNYIKYPSRFSYFMDLNKPNKFTYQFEIKNDIFIKALELPKNSCIIDCGAHIGDGTIPLAHALNIYNRNDIIIYAIEPSLYKCNFIKDIAKINNLSNIKVLNYGLCNKNGNYYISKKINKTNSGANIWSEKNTHINTSKFTKIDDLFEIIKENLGIIHLDVEGYEYDVIKGGENILNKYKPYLSIENFPNTKKNIDVLPKEYKYIKKIDLNDIYSID